MGPTGKRDLVTTFLNGPKLHQIQELPLLFGEDLPLSKVSRTLRESAAMKPVTILNHSDRSDRKIAVLWTFQKGLAPSDRILIGTNRFPESCNPAPE